MAYKNEEQRLVTSLPPELSEIIRCLNLPGKPTQRVIWLIEEGIAAHPELLRQRNEKRLDSAPKKIPSTTPPQQ